MVKWLIGILTVVIIFSGTSLLIFRYYKQEKTAADNLALSLKRQDISITIIEGKRREEIAEQLEKAGITSAKSFLAASQGDEGTLFPDTYRFFPNTPATEVVARMESDFTEKTAGLNLTRNQLILASIVEREASNDTDRPIIAGVYTNRLNIDMRMDSDPTVQYGKDTIDYAASGSSDFTFWKAITAADYQDVQSPYNTYTVAGLPPGPISNPGLKSIEAAISPQQNDYYYFLYKNGQLLLAKTLAEHNAQAAE